MLAKFRSILISQNKIFSLSFAYPVSFVGNRKMSHKSFITKKIDRKSAKDWFYWFSN